VIAPLDPCRTARGHQKEVLRTGYWCHKYEHCLGRGGAQQGGIILLPKQGRLWRPFTSSWRPEWNFFPLQLSCDSKSYSFKRSSFTSAFERTVPPGQQSLSCAITRHHGSSRTKKVCPFSPSTSSQQLVNPTTSDKDSLSNCRSFKVSICNPVLRALLLPQHKRSEIEANITIVGVLNWPTTLET